MSVATEQAPSRVHQDYEPDAFGQAGVSRYVGSFFVVVAWVCMMASLVMWRRSHSMIDSVGTISGHSETVIRSVYGRLMIRQIVYRQSLSEAGLGQGWSYGVQRLPRNLQDPWRPSLAKTIGFGFWLERAGDGSPTTADFASQGIVEARTLRVRWPLLVIVSGILPAVALTSRFRAWREDQRAAREAEA